MFIMLSKTSSSPQEIHKRISDETQHETKVRMVLRIRSSVPDPAADSNHHYGPLAGRAQHLPEA